MRAAPPVQVVCSGGVAWRAVQIALPAVTAVVFFSWVMLHLQLGSMWALAGPLLAFCAGWIVWIRLPVAPARLVWDGQTWLLDDVRGDLRVMLHLGSWLLLRHQTVGASPQWVAVCRADTGVAHPAFCAAVYCRIVQPTPAGSPRQP